MKNHDISVNAMIDAEDDISIGLSGRDAEHQFVRLCAAYNKIKEDKRELMEALERCDQKITQTNNTRREDVRGQVIALSELLSAQDNARTTIDRIKKREGETK